MSIADLAVSQGPAAKYMLYPYYVLLTTTASGKSIRVEVPAGNG